MTAEAKAVRDEVLKTFDRVFMKLPQTVYRDVLEELAADIQGRLDAVSDELAEDE